MRYSSAPDRRKAIARHVEDEGYSNIAELSNLLEVSEMTIRRDVLKLVADGEVRSFHGGVRAFGTQEFKGSLYESRALARETVKFDLARAALRFVGPEAIIALDAGTTIASLAKQLPSAAELRVVTASLPVITALATNSGVQLTALGGELHAESLSFAGPNTLSNVASIRVETLFLGASGLSERGVYCANHFDAVTKRALLEVARKVVLVCDSSKFATAAMAKVCGWNAIDVIVIDDGLPPERARDLEAMGIELAIVEGHLASSETSHS